MRFMAYMESFFQSHAYLVEHGADAVRRSLLDQIDWRVKVIGIKGPRGVGKTVVLRQIAAERYNLDQRDCLYVNMNSFYFQGRGLADFAGDFVRNGGRALLIDQVFKLPDWQRAICKCHALYPDLQLVYTTSSVEMPDEERMPELEQIGRTYMLHGLSFRSFLSLQIGQELPSYTFDEILNNHEAIQRTILEKVKPWGYLRDYLFHGYYPFYLEQRDFTESLLKSINMMLEIDVLLLKQIELKYLPKLKRLLYLLAVDGAAAPNVSRLAEDIKTSRATVMNYLRNLEEARLIRLIYKPGEAFPKKPALVMLHNTNLLHAIYANNVTEQLLMETFLMSCFREEGHTIYKDKREGTYLVNGQALCVSETPYVGKKHTADLRRVSYAADGHRVTEEIPIWLFGFMR